MRSAACPSCGAPVRFRGATSIVAVCAFCHSTLAREGVRLEDIGKQAELLDDVTPLRIGTEGQHRGIRFAIVGRIQYRYGAGVWNEWHVLFDDGKSGWLSDANRDYSISYLSPPIQVPGFDDLKPGEELQLYGDRYTVTDKQAAQVIAGEGELPFRFGSGWEARVADLRGAGIHFATIDYSEKVPHIYVGERLPFDTFKFAGLRDPAAEDIPKHKALAFQCKACGAAMEKRIPTTEVVACTSCGSVTDVSQGVGAIVQKNNHQLAGFSPSIPLGTVGRWKGLEYEVVGYMRRAVVVDNVRYSWGEYLLYNVTQGYRWIVESAGHFSVMSDTAEIPKPGRTTSGPDGSRQAQMRYLGRDFRHFQKSEAEVTYVAGEFYWQVKLGDTCIVNDYVAPPLILSAETTGNEINWSVGEYVEPDVLWKAFRLKGPPPRRQGVAPNQPSPHEGRTAMFWSTFAALLLAAIALQFGFIFAQSAQKPTAIPFSVSPGSGAKHTSSVFRISGLLGGPVTVRTSSNASDTWLALNLQLTNAESGAAYRLSRQLGFMNVGGAVTGSAYDIAEIKSLPSGRYTLTIDAKAGLLPNQRAGQPAREIKGNVELSRQPVRWLNFWLLAGFLALWPLVAWIRARAFESTRWSESDYAPTAVGSDDDE